MSSLNKLKNIQKNQNPSYIERPGSGTHDPFTTQIESLSICTFPATINHHAPAFEVAHASATLATKNYPQQLSKHPQIGPIKPAAAISNFLASWSFSSQPNLIHTYIPPIVDPLNSFLIFAHRNFSWFERSIKIKLDHGEHTTILLIT